MRRLIVSDDGRKSMWIYDDPRTDPPDWWKHVKVPTRKRRWLAIIAWIVIVGLFVWFSVRVLIPLLILKAVLALYALGNASVKRQKRGG